MASSWTAPSISTASKFAVPSTSKFVLTVTAPVTARVEPSNVRFALAKVSQDIWQREFDDFYEKYAASYKEGQLISGSDVRNFIYERVDTVSNERFTYSQSIIEQNYKVPTEFFENDFRNTIRFKNTDSNTAIGEYFEFKCNELNARKIADLFGSERKLYIKIGLTPVTNIRLSNCNDYEYQNDFFVKSLIISSDSSFYDENVVCLNFE